MNASRFSLSCRAPCTHACNKLVDAFHAVLRAQPCALLSVSRTCDRLAAVASLHAAALCVCSRTGCTASLAGALQTHAYRCMPSKTPPQKSQHLQQQQDAQAGTMPKQCWTAPSQPCCLHHRRTNSVSCSAAAVSASCSTASRKGCTGWKRYTTWVRAATCRPPAAATSAAGRLECPACA